MARRTHRIIAVFLILTAVALLVQGNLLMAASLTLCAVAPIRMGWGS